MGFGHRHRSQENLNGNGAVKKNDIDLVIIKADEISEEPVITLQEERIKVISKKKSKQAIKTLPGEPIISNEVKKEDIPVHKKIYEDNTGLVGQNTICTDFRAICKKKKLKMNSVLNTLLHKWNTENYCL